MKLTVNVSSDQVNYKITPGILDMVKIVFRKISKKSHLANFEFFFRYTFTISESKLNSDTLALSGLLSVYPYLGAPWLQLNFPVSNSFKKSVLTNLGLFLITPLAPIPELQIDSVGGIATAHKIDRNPGLAFSMGADSVAAKLLMPNETYALFIDRPEHPRSLYKKENLYISLDSFREQLSEVDVVESNFETIRSPVGFAVVDDQPDLNLSALAPLIAISSLRRLNSLALGTVRESLYGLGNQSYSNPNESKYFRGFSEVLSSLKLPLFLPLGGLSEVTSMKIATSNPTLAPWSCIRGGQGLPCMRCYKCFRKESLKADLLGKSWADEELSKVMNSPEVSRKLASRPLHHGNVLSWQAETFPKASYQELKPSLAPYKGQLEFIEKWYSRSENYIPEDYRRIFRRRLAELNIESTSPEEDRYIVGWIADDSQSEGRPLG
jgi:hypothetical protein